MNGIERRKNLAGEMGRAICNLANIVEDWNDAQEEPEERSRGNGAIGLVIFEDGSGLIADFQQTFDNNPLGNGYVVHKFSSPEEAEDWFMENISGRSLYAAGTAGPAAPGGTDMDGDDDEFAETELSNDELDDEIDL